VTKGEEYVSGNANTTSLVTAKDTVDKSSAHEEASLLGEELVPTAPTPPAAANANIVASEGNSGGCGVGGGTEVPANAAKEVPKCGAKAMPLEGRNSDSPTNEDVSVNDDDDEVPGETIMLKPASEPLDGEWWPSESVGEAHFSPAHSPPTVLLAALLTVTGALGGVWRRQMGDCSTSRREATSWRETRPLTCAKRAVAREPCTDPSPFERLDLLLATPAALLSGCVVTTHCAS
jgi:hypothetical protein